LSREESRDRFQNHRRWIQFQGCAKIEVCGERGCPQTALQEARVRPIYVRKFGKLLLRDSGLVSSFAQCSAKRHRNGVSVSDHGSKSLRQGAAEPFDKIPNRLGQICDAIADT